MFNYIAAFLGFFAVYSKLIKIIFRKKWEKEVKVKPGAGPFFYKANRKSKHEKGILLIHGFTGAADDTKELAKYLAKKGITSHAMLMKGHGTSPENLATTTFDDWYGSVEQAYLELKKKVKKVYVAGDSFGGNMSLLLASKHPVAGVIPMGTPIFFRKRKIYAVLYYLFKHFKNFQKKWYHPSIHHQLMKKRMTYKKIPINLVPHVIKGVDSSRKALSKITAPLLVMQSTTDFAVSEKSVDYLMKNTKSKKKRLVWIADAYHVFIVDKDREKAFEEIYNFIRDT